MNDNPAGRLVDWHTLAADEALAQLGSDAARGLDAATVQQRRAEHGPNALPEPAPTPGWRRLARHFQSPLVAILVVAAVLAVALGHLGDAAVILVVVVVNAVIGLVQEGRAERSMAALRRLAALQVRVRRDGREQVLPARELVPGDLLLLAAGDQVAADARLAEAAQLHVAEAALTGESVPVAKALAPLPPATSLADRRCMVYAGTHVTTGRALAVVVATGARTEVGRIAGLTQSAVEPRTPLEQRIHRFGQRLVAAGIGLFVIVVLLGLWRRLPLAEVLMVAISQMVSMVPEGLPVAMTIALAVGMQRMAARGAIIRRLSAVETLGSTTVICSDKTGTLTRNQMTAVALWLPTDQGRGRHVEVSGSGYALHGSFSQDGQPLPSADPALQPLLHAAALCNDALLQPPIDDGGDWAVQGDPTEAALRVLAAKAGIDLAALDAAAPREAELPFDADVQLMATRHRLPQAPRTVFVKGSPEAVLRLCSGPTPVHHVAAARHVAEAMATRALRVLAFARIDDETLDGGFDALAGRAALLGLVGQIDPPRDEVRQAIAACRAAGVRTVMLTGDHKLTGLAIARALGIAGEGELAKEGGGAWRAVDGTELERMGERELHDALPAIAVFSRVQPAQKLRIVRALQARGEVVAMTGDGVNDAPALAQADVGVAMGITGTEVAKSAARIVISDDNFATIVAAIEQGRVVYGNLKKVILYLFATSVDEVLVLLLALLAGLPLPLAAVQILWINIVTEGTLTVNLVLDPPDGDEMRRPPTPRADPLIDRGMLQRVLLMAGTAVAATFGWFVWRSGQGVPLEQLRTETFTVLAMCQWFNLLNCQSATMSALRGGLLRNRWLLLGLAASVVLQLAVLYLPLLNAMFHTVPLPVDILLPLLAAASGVLWVEEARKLWARRRRRPGPATGSAVRRG
ncbi:MAG: HAD-IC family P-type ATPase [Rubrivivax sp.]|nr:HAD-IC family P-type ATPase [Rubrivivax sp.]